MNTERIIEIPKWRDRRRVMHDRAEAGTVLASLLGRYRDTDTLIFAIPAGGVPVAAPLARELDLPLHAVVVSKITPPWNTELGYGAVASGGILSLNEELRDHLGLTAIEVEEGIRRAREKVDRRTRRFGMLGLPASLAGRTVIVVDDGLASGLTMNVAIEVLRERGASRIIVAVPTGHNRTVERLAHNADQVVCPNIRGGPSFAVAEAYEIWTDVEEDDAVALIEEAARSRAGSRALKKAL